jgi:hypothetical protein
MSPELVLPTLRLDIKIEKQRQKREEKRRERKKRTKREMTVSQDGQPIVVEAEPTGSQEAKQEPDLEVQEEESEVEEVTELFPGEEDNSSIKEEKKIDKFVEDEFLAYFRRSRRTM